MINNPRHVKDMRDAIHHAIQTAARHRGLGPGDLSGRDLLTAVLLVARDIIRDAPDQETRHILSGVAIGVMNEASRPVLMKPPIGHA